MQYRGVTYLHDLGYHVNDYIYYDLIYWNPITQQVDNNNDQEPLGMYLKKYPDGTYLLIYDPLYGEKEVSVIILPDNTIKGMGAIKHKNTIINFIEWHRKQN